MSRLRVLSGRKVGRILQRHEFVEVRRAGVISRCRGAPTPALSPSPFLDHPELAIGTLLSIIRQSGVPRAEFEE